MKIRNLIYGTIAGLFTINTAFASSCSQITCPTGYIKVASAYGCECQKGQKPMDEDPTPLTELNENNNKQVGGFTGGTVLSNDDLTEPQEICETKEINGDITSCCHTESSSGSTGIKDLFNAQSGNNINIQNMNTVNGGI